jgi:uncharacterized protein (TIGR03066 family)
VGGGAKHDSGKFILNFWEGKLQSNALTLVAKPIDASKLIGVWELTSAEGEEAPYWRIEFINDGKLRMTARKADGEYKVEGTYALKEDKLTLTVVVDGKVTDTRTIAIQKLTGAALSILDLKKMEFKRAK